MNHLASSNVCTFSSLLDGFPMAAAASPCAGRTSGAFTEAGGCLRTNLSNPWTNYEPFLKETPHCLFISRASPLGPLGLPVLLLLSPLPFWSLALAKARHLGLRPLQAPLPKTSLFHRAQPSPGQPQYGRPPPPPRMPVTLKCQQAADEGRHPVGCTWARRYSGPSTCGLSHLPGACPLAAATDV